MKENFAKQCGRASQLELLLCISAGVRGRPERWTPFGAEGSTGRNISHGTESTLMRNVQNHGILILQELFGSTAFDSRVPAYAKACISLW